jgi:Conjugative transfer region protein TrbK
LEAGVTEDPPATKLAECRSITHGQKDELAECRKAWAAKRHQFLGQKAPASSDTGASRGGASLFVVPKDENRLSPGSFPTPQSEKE